MIVRELIQELMAMDEKAVVILQKDAEGNGYSPLAGVTAGKYVEENGWSGNFVGDDDAHEDDDGIEGVVLYPTN